MYSDINIKHKNYEKRLTFLSGLQEIIWISFWRFKQKAIAIKS